MSEPIEMQFPVDDGVVTISGNPQLVLRFVGKFWPELLIGIDRELWPQGHPCRDCGRLYGEHPVHDGDALGTHCEEWR